MKVPKNEVGEHNVEVGGNHNSSSSMKINKSSHQPSMLSFLFDLPNFFTLCALLSAFVGLYFAALGSIYFAVICGMWAVVFDWIDGLVASKMIGRTKENRAFGAQLDSLSDLVSFGVLPAMILLSYTDYHFGSLLVGFSLVAGCAIRLSYFNVFGLTNGKSYTGLAVDNNGLLLSFAFLFESLFSKSTFSIGLTLLSIVIVALNLSSIQIPKLSKKWLIPIVMYVICMTIYLGSL